MSGPRIRSIPKARRKPAEPFSVREALQRSMYAFENPPLRPHIERVKPVGQCQLRLAVPIGLCPSGNMTRHGNPHVLGRLKSQCLALMRAQLSTAPTSPFGGRPQVLATRFSSYEPDAYADWAKIPVDCLVKLGLIADDNPRAIALHQWWEPAPRGKGFVLLEVYSGA